MRLIRPGFKILQHLEYAQMLHLVCQAISNCYKAPFPETQKEREAFISARVKAKHETVLEHVGFSVTFVVDRGVTHEMVRHRLCAFTQESTRYCNYSKSKFGGHVTFILPPFMQEEGIPDGLYYLFQGSGVSEQDPLMGLVHATESGATAEHPEIVVVDPAAQIWLQAMQNAEICYLQAVNDVKPGPFMPPEIARGMLPNSLKTEITWTANMREWRHIFRLRALGATGRPHPQMTEIMNPLLAEVLTRFPVFFQDLTA